ncbi:MAG: FGGY family carbohydrate kinase [Acidimicrobiales bacterium]
MSQVLGVAFGPRSTEVEVRDLARGTLLATGTARHADLGRDVDIHDPIAWWRSLAAAIAEAGEREIAAISVSGSHPGLVLLDGAGAVLRPVQPWSDAAAERDAARLRKALGAERWARQAGMLPTPRAAVTRLAWLRRTDPETYSRIGAALLPHDWLTYRLAGRPVTDRGTASLTGAWSPSTDGWIEAVLAELGGRAADWEPRLPEVLGPTERADWLDAPVYELLGLRGRPLVAPGTGEPMATALALGLTPGRAGVSLAGSTTVLVGLRRPIVDPTGGVRSRADATGRHLAMATAAGGAAAVAVVSELVGLPADQLGALAMTATDLDRDLVVVPGVAGRSGAVLTGLRPGVSRSSLARAAFDGISCAALDALDHAVDAGATWDDDEPLRLTGPTAGLDAHAQVLASLADRPVLYAGGSLAAAGACVQAAAVLAEEPPEVVAERWDLLRGTRVDPVEDPHRLARRLANAEERSRQRRALLDSG